jgi:nitrogen regulatory protein P-II 1
MLPIKERSLTHMKKIECIIQTKKLTDLEQALRAAGVPGMTVSEVKGFGNEQTRPDSYLFLPKTKVDIYCGDDILDHLVDTILRVCGTGNLGDGKIVVTTVDEIIRIRTGERGRVAV